MNKWLGVIMMTWISKFVYAQDPSNNKESVLSSGIYIALGLGLILIIIVVLIRRQKRRFND